MPYPNPPHHVRHRSQRSNFAKRSSTDDSVQRSNTITLSKLPPVDYVKENIKAYNLNWKELREWLITERFKDYPGLGESLAEETNIQDNFRLWLPESLTEDDFKTINKLRRRATQIDRTARQTNSPDPDFSDDD